MTYIADANFVLRLIDKASAHHTIARGSLAKIQGRGDTITLAPQSLFEFYAVATRPKIARGGLGLSPTDAARWMRVFQSLFELLPELPIFAHWERLVATYQTSGAASHDARYVALMLAHGLTHILTFNGSDFTRYTPEGIVVVDPQTI